jgi:serine/threonine-protein kinase HipA
MNVKKAPAIIQQIAETVAKWHEFAEQVKVESELRDAIGKTLLII